jgi:hypothetical protein
MSYIALANTTISGTSTTQITFGSIPTSVNGQSLRDLVLIFAGDGTSGGADIAIQLNGDTGNNYNRVFMGGSGSGSGFSGSNANVGRMDVISAANGRQLNFTWNLMDYSATDKHKTALVRDNDAGFQVVARAFRWASLNAVNSVRVFVSAGAFTNGTTLALYGIAG